MSERNADLTAAIKSIGGNFDKFTQLSEQRFNDLQGRIEEIGFPDEVYLHPEKEYVRRLIEAIPGERSEK